MSEKTQDPSTPIAFREFVKLSSSNDPFVFDRVTYNGVTYPLENGEFTTAEGVKMRVGVDRIEHEFRLEPVSEKKPIDARQCLTADELSDIAADSKEQRIEDMAREMFLDTVYPADDSDGVLKPDALRKVSREVAAACFIAAEEFYSVAEERAAFRMRQSS